MTGAFRLFYRGFCSLLIILLVTVLMSVTWPLGARRLTRSIMQGAFRVAVPLWGIRIRVEGALAPVRPLIVASNHFTYLDLFVLGSVVPAAFTPKSEIRSWPLLGFMSKVSGCLFIERRAMRTRQNQKRLSEALAQGDIISLFPEGTTSEGLGLLPFKSSLFSLAEASDVPVQPVSIVYTRLNGKPIGKPELPIVGWYGDSYFFPHVTAFLKQKSIDAVLVFHAPLNARDFPSRKELARAAQEAVERGMKEVVG